MQTLLVVFHMMLSVGLISLILIQHGKGADMGAAFGSGASATVFGARGSGSFLSRTTAILATLFFVTSMALAYFAAQVTEPVSVMDKVETRQIEQPAPPESEVPLPPGAQAPGQIEVPVPQESAVPAAPQQGDTAAPGTPGQAAVPAESAVLASSAPAAEPEATAVPAEGGVPVLPGQGAEEAVPVAPASEQGASTLESATEPAQEGSPVEVGGETVTPSLVEPADTDRGEEAPR